MKKQNIIMGISFILLIFMVIGVSYAAYKFSAAGTKENVISTGTISMSYSQNSFIDLKHTYPKTDTYAIATKEDKSSMEFSVSMETSGTKQINYALAITNIEEGTTLKSDKVKIYLEKEGKVVNNFETNKGKTIDSFKNKYIEGLIDSYAIYQDILTISNKTHHYTLTSWIDESYILPIKNETTTTKQTNEETYKFKVKVVGVDTPITIEEKSTVSSLDTSGANAPVLASNMIPVYYDETSGVWKKADKNNKDNNNRWYSYESSGEYKGMWANAVTVKDTNRQTYLNATPGTTISMNDITTMWVWIPRFNAVTPNNYNGGTKAKPNAIDVTYAKQNEPAIDAFTFGNKELSGFWYGKFETGHATLASNTTKNNLGCTNEICNNANGIIIKPNVTSLQYNNLSNFFFASRSMEQTGNSFGFIKDEVDTHMSKNNEWGAVAYLTQSIYGRCTDSTTCAAVGINNNKNTITGYGAPAGSNDSATNGAYNTTLGKDASTTKNIYGIYDMAGGSYEFVMGIFADTNGKPRSGYTIGSNSGFTGMLSDGTTYTGIAFPDSKYYNLYTGSSYTGHALTETQDWYGSFAFFADKSQPCFYRGGGYNMSLSAIIFNFIGSPGGGDKNLSSRFVIINE
ncbi:MAG TPA: hypothetical protein OIM65_05180 [Bacilli bacterium]|nr:hypothetical protein [Bacilli bacterium]